MRYLGSYKAYGAAGGPLSMQDPYLNGGPHEYFIQIQGGDTIPSQMYHDLYFGYAFGGGAAAEGQPLVSRALADVTLQLGIKNVFDKMAPFVATGETYYASTYGDMRLRSYWLRARKQF